MVERNSTNDVTQTLKGLVKEMLKFFKSKKKKKNPEIRKVADCWSDGTQTGRVFAVIGQVKELVKESIIFPDNTNGNENKWLIVRNNDDNTIYECSSLEEAKDFCRIHCVEW